MDWQRFRNITESKWSSLELYQGVWGYQIQPGTKWNCGLDISKVNALQNQMGFSFPITYREFLSELNGFDRDCVDFHAEEEPETFGRTCYQYPNDLERIKWLVDEIEEYRRHVNQALKNEGFRYENIEGFVPLYGHRALVVFTDKSLSPVISIVGDDVIVYGKTLEEYWRREFEIE
ncbi:MAG: SMI1/KNR4 family protein [Gammaproteobacteria bacterium]|nr:SMI1/KNR4 family protein [Gammaproteobacteria bacterium]